jgi:amino acid transporter
MRKVGFPENRVELLAAAEVAGAIGLVLGMWYWPIGVAAAIGLIMYFVGAVGAHVLKRDWNITASVVLLAVAIAVLVLRLMTR